VHVHTRGPMVAGVAGTTAARMIRVESPKNVVEVGATQVTKRYKPGFKGARRFHRELEALRRLAGIDGIPLVLAQTEFPMTLVASRIAGIPLADCTSEGDAVFLRLRTLVAVMLLRGVARHSIPARDILVGPDSQVGMVDFERVSLRGWRFHPRWLVASMVTRFHLLRILGERAPHLLTARERRRLKLQWRLRNFFHVLIELRRWLRGQKPGRQKLADHPHCPSLPSSR
jgi:hypothetical protein